MDYWPQPVRAACVGMLSAYHVDVNYALSREPTGVSTEDLLPCLLDLLLVLLGDRHDGDIDAGLRELGQAMLVS